MSGRVSWILRRLMYPRSYAKIKGRTESLILSRHGVIIRPDQMTVGRNVFINRGFHISARDLRIGSDVMFGPNLVIECDNHSFSTVGKTMFETRDQKEGSGVSIGRDVWAGANVTILAGAVIGEGCVIGAGSVVTDAMPPYTVCYGVPCKPRRLRFNLDDLAAHLEIVGSELKIADLRQSLSDFPAPGR